MIKNILKILAILIGVCLLILAITYVYVSSKHARLQEEMRNSTTLEYRPRIKSGKV